MSPRTRIRRANVDILDGMNMDLLKARLGQLAEEEVHIGMQGDAELAMIAGVHEYGSVKMHIPARSFIGTGKKKSQAPISKLVRRGVNEIAQGSRDAASLYEEIGQLGLEKTKANFERIKKPPLSAKYALTKTGSKLLQREDDLHKSLTYKIARRR